MTGEDIPIGARILSVVDCFDALTSDRPYRRALSDEAAIAILRERRGPMYDPTVVDTFLAIRHQVVAPESGEADDIQALKRLIRPNSSDASPAPKPTTASETATPGGVDMPWFASLSRLAAGTMHAGRR